MSQQPENAVLEGRLKRRYRILFAIARGLALLLGAFSLLNVLGEIRNPGFDANLWWIDLRFASRQLNRLLMIVVGTGLISFAIRPRSGPLVGWLLSALLSLLIVVAAMNSWTYYRLVWGGVIRSGAVVPLSGLVLVALGLILWAIQVRSRVHQAQTLERVTFGVTVLVFAALFPLAQMYCFGLTDYRRPADVIVVFGCRVYSDGQLSLPLSDRVKTAVELYSAGLAPRLLFSGGPGDGAVHETEAMRQLAMRMGVPASAIDVDLDGLSTQETVRNMVGRSEFGPETRVLAVSTFYHLPRIKLCFRRAGWEVSTVPAKETRRLNLQELYMAREVAALWWYYLNPN